MARIISSAALMLWLGSLTAISEGQDRPAAERAVRIGSGVSGHIHPAVCIAKSGVIVVIYGKSDYKDLRQTVSKDGGKTWTESVAVAPTEKLSLYPGSLTALKDGRIVHAWNTWYVDEGKDKKEKSRFVQFSISSDDGKTWGGGKELAEEPGGIQRHPASVR